MCSTCMTATCCMTLSLFQAALESIHEVDHGFFFLLGGRDDLFSAGLGCDQFFDPFAVAVLVPGEVDMPGGRRFHQVLSQLELARGGFGGALRALHVFR